MCSRIPTALDRGATAQNSASETRGPLNDQNREIKPASVTQSKNNIVTGLGFHDDTGFHRGMRAVITVLNTPTRLAIREQHNNASRKGLHHPRLYQNSYICVGMERAEVHPSGPENKYSFTERGPSGFRVTPHLGTQPEWRSDRKW